MRIEVGGHGVYAYTGSRPFIPAQPTMVFVHGAANDHGVWALQSRYFAHHGANVLAVELPGHGKSGGEALTSVDALGDWIIAVLDALGVARATLVWAFGGSLAVLAAAAFFMQMGVQGAWGIIPVHLNELSPDEIRGTFPGFTYQLGNLLAAVNAPMQAGIAQAHGGDYAFALAMVAAVVAVSVAVLAGFGPEQRGIAFGRDARVP